MSAFHQVKGGQEKTFEMYLFHDAEAFFGMATTFGARHNPVITTPEP